ncbi:hypothetical protein [Planococcus lenghuensis]|nr:hypothetical protein [Planococcus lenghuensis]
MNWEHFKEWVKEKGYETGAISWKETRKLIKKYRQTQSCELKVREGN